MNILIFLKHYACLPARKSISSSGDKTCNTNNDCFSYMDTHWSCIYPLTNNQTRFIKLEHSMGDSILYVGKIRELILSSLIIYLYKILIF